MTFLLIDFLNKFDLQNYVNPVSWQTVFIKLFCLETQQQHFLAHVATALPEMLQQLKLISVGMLRQPFAAILHPDKHHPRLGIVKLKRPHTVSCIEVGGEESEHVGRNMCIYRPLRLHFGCGFSNRPVAFGIYDSGLLCAAESYIEEPYSGQSSREREFLRSAPQKQGHGCHYGRQRHAHPLCHSAAVV